MSDSNVKPVLWHIPVSHYSEKVRWALDHKGIDHERRAPMPGAHVAVALWLTRGREKTFPVMRIDGRIVGDSSAIIEALDRRWQDHPLIPAEPDERRRALELEEFFDEELGPHIRLFAWHELRRDPERMRALAAAMAPAALQRLPGADAIGGRFATAFVQLRYRVASDEAAAAARAKVLEALDRLEAELDATGTGYLAGDSFTVADLTAAALFYPMVDPPEGPQIIPAGNPAAEEFFGPMRDRAGGRWVTEMFARHRRPAAALVS
jgi:glutathione S-transferase